MLYITDYTISPWLVTMRHHTIDDDDDVPVENSILCVDHQV